VSEFLQVGPDGHPREVLEAGEVLLVGGPEDVGDGPVAGLDGRQHAALAVEPVGDEPLAGAARLLDDGAVRRIEPVGIGGQNPAEGGEVGPHVALRIADDDATGRDREVADEAHGAFVRLQRDLGVLPSGLNQLAGVTDDDVDGLAARTIESQGRLLASNPRRVTESTLRDVFREALHNW
jgi:hypothetical protein